MTKINTTVAFFVGFFGGGGIERMTANLAHGLVKLGIQIDLITSPESPNLWQMPTETRIIDLKARNLYMCLPALVNYLRQEQPTVLFSADHYQNEIALMAKLIARVPTKVIVSERNQLSKTVANATKLKHRLTPIFAHFLYPWADEIIAVSQGVAKDLAQTASLPPAKIQLLYNPVITQSLFVKAKEHIDHPWFNSSEIPVILGVGKLEAQKDFPMLIRAFAQVLQVRPCRLVILGWGPDRPKLEALIQELGLEADIDLLGHVPNPYAFMARSTVFTLSSSWEGFGNVLVEAMALGIPVISTNCESGPFEILAGGKYGYLLPVGNSEAMADAILQVLAGHQKLVEPEWLKQFSLEASLQNYLRVFNINPFCHSSN